MRLGGRLTVAGFVTCLAALLALTMQGRADMGRVYISTDDATVSESAQKAIIIHNTKEEILILGTELQASRRTPILRFIPFPAEPDVRLAPKDVFARLGAMVSKYRLQYVTAYHSKGGAGSISTDGVEVRFAAKLGGHDLTTIKVTNVAVFRNWINDYFRKHKMPRKATYPDVERIVSDYVARGIRYFVLDAVDVGTESAYVDPIAYRFASKSLYYPLKTSNSFGGSGEIELFIIAQTTLCIPGSGIFLGDSDMASNPKGETDGPCLGLPVKASTSVRLVEEEKDLATLYPDAAGFFNSLPVFFQAIRYVGPYKFDKDVLIPMPQGAARDFGPPVTEAGSDNPFETLLPAEKEICRKAPDPGSCKGLFDGYYFDRNSQSCKHFFWGGCKGSRPFSTLEECNRSCKPTLPR